MSRFDEIFQNEIPITVFCSPEGPFTKNGVEYPDRINEEQYKLLKDCGINVVYGHEVFMDRPDSVAELFKSMDICEKLGLVYFVRDYHTNQYCWKAKVGHDGLEEKLWSDRTEEEKAAIDAKYEANLRVYKDHPAFGGVLFCDEPGSANFEAIKAGKAVFDRVCPGKRFYTNLFPMYSHSKLLQYGVSFYDGPIDPEYEVFKHTNLERFQYHFDKFMDIVDPDIVSFDAYTYWHIGGIYNTVHRAQWDMTQYVSNECRKKGKEYWHFLQVGGKFDGESHLRITNFGEVNLGISVALGYGARALELFTGCSPNCYQQTGSHDGIIDGFGKITEQYPMYQYAFMQVKAIEKYLVHADLKAQIVSTAPYFGLLPDAKVVRAMEDQWKGAGDTVFDGTFLPDGNIQVREYGALKGITSTSQCIVSCFEKNGETFYFLWNNSPYAASDVTLHFDDEYVYEHTQRTVTDRSEGKDLTIHALPAGENVLVRITGKK